MSDVEVILSPNSIMERDSLINIADSVMKEKILNIYADFVYEKIITQGQLIGAHKGYPILLFKLSFSDILKNYRFYNLYFNKNKMMNFFKLIFTCGGACTFKLNSFNYDNILYDSAYIVIINSDNVNLLDERTINFIVSHEKAHIQNGNCETNYNWIGNEEFLADSYAKQQGYRISSSVLKLTFWQVGSYHYIRTSKNIFIGFVYTVAGIFKHYYQNMKRKYK